MDRLIIENGILWNISNHRAGRFNVIYRLNNYCFNLFFFSYSVKCFKSLSIDVVRSKGGSFNVITFYIIIC